MINGGSSYKVINFCQYNTNDNVRQVLHLFKQAFIMEIGNE